MLITKFINTAVAKRNQQRSRYVFSKVIQCLEKNIQKHKVIAKDYRVQNSWAEYKIFILKYVNRNVTR